MTLLTTLSFLLNGITAVELLLRSPLIFPGIDIDTRLIGGAAIVFLSGLLAAHYYQLKRDAEIKLDFVESQMAGLHIEAELAQPARSKMQSR